MSASPWSHLDPEEVTALLSGANYVQNELIVALQESAPNFADVLAVESARDAVTTGAIAAQISLGSTADGSSLYQLRLAAGADFEDTLSAISNWTSVEWVTPNFVDATSGGEDGSPLEAHDAPPVATIDTIVIPSGRYDPTFDGDGLVALASPFGSNDVVRDMVRQADGKFLVVGAAGTGSLYRNALVRYNSDGTLDSSFGAGGVTWLPIVSTGALYPAHKVRIAGDGKIVVASDGGVNLVVSRLNSDGSLDDTFGNHGTAAFTPAGVNVGSEVGDVGLAVLADGSVVAARYGTITVSAFLVKFNAAGALDTSFDGDGFASIGLASLNYALSDIAVQGDGKIIVAGTRSTGTRDFFAARLLATGAFDATFGTGGFVAVDFGASTSDAAYRLALQGDGKIVLAGATGNDVALARLNVDGTLDTSFNGTGKVVSNLGNTESAFALAIQSDGKIVVGGQQFSSSGGRDEFLAVRYTASGALDTSFDGDGWRTFALGGGRDWVTAVSIQPDGRIVLAGTTTATSIDSGDFRLVRLETDGSFDPTFGTGGITAPLNLGPGSSQAGPMLVLPDGRLLVAGSVFESGNVQERFAVWRLAADGSLDPTFGTGGIAWATSGITDAKIGAMVRQSNGSILLLDTSTNRLIRLTADGALDTSFDGDGWRSTGTLFSDATTLTLLPDDRFVVGGHKANSVTGDDEFSLVRYLADGTLDASFGVGGQVLLDAGIGDDEVFGVARQADGKLVVVGSDSDGSVDFYSLVRLNIDGSLDTSFSGDGKLTQPTVNGTIEMHAVIIQADGRIVVGGGDSADLVLYRYLSDGTLDASFGVGGRAVYAALSEADQILQQSDGKLIAVGDPGNNFAAIRFTTAGVVDTSFDGDDGVYQFRSGFVSNLRFPGAVLDSSGNLLIARSQITGYRQETVVVRILTAPAAAGASPTVSSIADRTIDEAGHFDFTFTTTDADSPDAWLQVSVASTDHSLIAPGDVTIERLGSGQWTVSVDAQARRSGTVVLTVRAWDGATSATQSFTVTVNPINNAPTFVKGADVAAGAGLATTLAAWARGMSTGAEDERLQALSFVVTAADPSLFDVQPSITPDGTLAFAAKASAAGQSTTVTVRLQDDGGTAGGGVDLSAPQTFTINIGQAPVIDPITDQTILEHGATPPINFAVVDADTAPGSVTVTAASGNTAILAASGLVFSNLGGGNYRITAAPVADRFGSVPITVTATDGVRTTVRLFTLNVTNVNDAPTFLKGQDQYVASSAGPQSIARWAQGISAGTQEASQGLTFIVTVDDPSLFAVGPAISADGTLTFTPATGKSGIAHATVRLQDDGGTADGGINTTAEQSFVIRTLEVGSTAGAFDPTFDGNGVVSFASDRSSGTFGQKIAVQSDGKIVVAGNNQSGTTTSLYVARLNADGSFDASFGDGGSVSHDVLSTTEIVGGLKIGVDGKIYVSLSSSGEFQMVRLNTDGSRDATFGVAGVATAVSAGISETTAELAIQADGRIVVVGTGANDLAAVRFLNNGTVDTSFGVNGFFRQSIGAGADQLYDVAIQSDGRIVAVGIGQLDGSRSGSDVVVIRLTAAGTLDTTFDGDGVAVVSRILTGSSLTDRAERIVVDAQGRILVSAVSTVDIGLLRLNADGTLDRSFGADGWAVADISAAEFSQDMAIAPDGRIAVVASLISNFDDVVVVRFTTDGRLDTSFDHDGYKDISFGPANGDVSGVATDAQGRIVIVGRAITDQNAGAAVVRLADDGSFDSTFDADGWAPLAPPSSVQFSSVVRQSDGKYVVGGVRYQVQASGSFIAPRLIVGRYLADGSLDTTFGVGGFAEHPAAFAAAAIVSLQSDGKILAFAANTSNSASTVVRFNADGTPDMAFGGDGSPAYPNGFPTSFMICGVVVQPDGKILVGGTLSSNFAVLRYHANGTLDTTFSGDGLHSVDLGGTETARAIALLPNGRILIAGSSPNGSLDFALLRINSDGTTDTTFDGDGWVRNSVGTSNDTATSIVVQLDGKVVLAGTTSSTGSTTSNDWALMRYNVDGSLDTSFDGDGIVTYVAGPGSDSLAALRLQADGQLVAVGSAVNGTATDTLVARFLADGRLDPTFGQDGLLLTPLSAGIDAAQAVSLDPDGKIVVVGHAERNGRYEARIFRLLNEVDEAPTVAGVYVKGSAWSASFLNHLDANGLGTAGLGYALAGGTSQLTVTIPWSNVDRITLRFDRDVVATVGSLVLYNSAGDTIAATGFRYIDGRTVEWIVPTLTADKYQIHVDATKLGGIAELALDGDWNTAETTWLDGSGDGTAGGNFDFRFNALPGDFDSSGSVAFGELGQARAKIGFGSTTAGYGYRQDFDGTGSITFADFGQARGRLGTGISGFADPPPTPDSPLPDSTPATELLEFQDPANGSIAADSREYFQEFAAVRDGAEVESVPFAPALESFTQSTGASESSMFVAASIFLKPAAAVDVGYPVIDAIASLTDRSEVSPLTYDLPFARFNRTAIAEHEAGPYLRPARNGSWSFRPQEVATVGSLEQLGSDIRTSDERLSSLAESTASHRPHGWNRLRRRAHAEHVSDAGPGVEVSLELDG